MTQDELTGLVSEIVDARIQRSEIERLRLLTALREIDALLTLQKEQRESQIKTLYSNFANLVKN